MVAREEGGGLSARGCQRPGGALPEEAGTLLMRAGAITAHPTKHADDRKGAQRLRVSAALRRAAQGGRNAPGASRFNPSSHASKKEEYCKPRAPRAPTPHPPPHPHTRREAAVVRGWNYPCVSRCITIQGE